MREVAILSAVRTAIGRAPRGVFKNTRPDDLAAVVTREALVRADVQPATIEDVVLGCAHPEAEHRRTRPPARQGGQNDQAK